MPSGRCPILHLSQSLHSSYFLHILGVCVEKGHYCIVTELAKRGSLYSVLHSDGPLSQALRNRLALEKSARSSAAPATPKKIPLTIRLDEGCAWDSCAASHPMKPPPAPAIAR